MLSGHRIVTGRLYLSAWGIGWAEAVLDAEVPLSGRVVLTLADLTFVGTIVSGGPGPTGRSAYTVAGGSGAWGKSIPRRSYANDAGVKAATVLADAASACGEPLAADSLPATRLGLSWARDEGPAARTLEIIAPAGWYVGEDGITRIGKRAPKALGLSASVTSIDRARGVVTVAADSIASIVPGAIIEGLEAVDVLHEISPGTKLRSTIWGAGTAVTSRRLTALARIFDALDPDRRFRGVYEYRIVSQVAERLNLQPVRVSTGMPDLERVTVRPGVPGTKAMHALGSRVLVAFIDASPSFPVVIGFENAEGEGFAPLAITVKATAINLGEPALLGAARFSDTVQAGPFGGVITGASTITRIA